MVWLLHYAQSDQLSGVTSLVSMKSYALRGYCVSEHNTCIILNLVDLRVRLTFRRVVELASWVASWSFGFAVIQIQPGLVYCIFFVFSSNDMLVFVNFLTLIFDATFDMITLPGAIIR